jgi:hypothetical protein
MAIYFASNRLGNFSASSSAISEVLTAGTYYPTVQSAISIPGTSIPVSDYVSAPVIMDATSVTTIYTTGDFYISASSLSGSLLWSAVNSIGQVVARISAPSTSSSMQFSYWNGAAYVNAGVAFTYPVGSLFTLNVKLVCGAAGSVDIWLGAYGAQVLVAAVPSSTGLNAAVNAVSACRFHNPCNAIGYVSMIALADYDLRSIRLTSDSPSAAGTFNDGTGAFTDVNSFPRDVTTSRVLSANGNKFTSPHTARALPGNMVIQSLVVNAALRTQGGVVTNARPGLYIGGVWYPMGNVNPVPNGGYENRAGYALVSPATTAVFTQAEYNTLEFGNEART